MGDPSRSWDSVPEAWYLSLGMIALLLLLLFFAVKGDREELNLVLGLLAGKKKDEMRQSLEKQRRKAQGVLPLLKSKASKKSGRLKRLESGSSLGQGGSTAKL